MKRYVTGLALKAVTMNKMTYQMSHMSVMSVTLGKPDKQVSNHDNDTERRTAGKVTPANCYVSVCYSSRTATGTSH